MIDDRLSREFDRVAESHALDLRGALSAAQANASAARRRRVGITAAAMVVAVGAGVTIAVQLDGQHDGTPAESTPSLITTARTLNGYPAAQVHGTVLLDEDCVVVGGRIALFPPGTVMTDGVITPPGGASARLGSEVSNWGGGYFTVGSTRDIAGSDEVYQSIQRCAEITGAKEVALISP